MRALGMPGPPRKSGGTVEMTGKLTGSTKLEKPEGMGEACRKNVFGRTKRRASISLKQPPLSESTSATGLYTEKRASRWWFMCGCVKTQLGRDSLMGKMMM